MIVKWTDNFKDDFWVGFDEKISANFDLKSAGKYFTLKRQVCTYYIYQGPFGTQLSLASVLQSKRVRFPTKIASFKFRKRDSLQSCVD